MNNVLEFWFMCASAHVSGIRNLETHELDEETLLSFDNSSAGGIMTTEFLICCRCVGEKLFQPCRVMLSVRVQNSRLSWTSWVQNDKWQAEQSPGQYCRVQLKQLALLLGRQFTLHVITSREITEINHVCAFYGRHPLCIFTFMVCRFSSMFWILLLVAKTKTQSLSASLPCLLACVSCNKIFPLLLIRLSKFWECKNALSYLEKCV